MSSTWAPPSPGTSLAGDPEEKNRAGWIGEDFPGCAPGAWPSPRARSPISPSEGRGASAEGGRPSSRGRRNSRGRHLPPSKGGFGRATEARQTLAPPPVGARQSLHLCQCPVWHISPHLTALHGPPSRVDETGNYCVREALAAVIIFLRIAAEGLV